MKASPRWPAGSRLQSTPKVGARIGDKGADGKAITFTDVQQVSADSGWVLALTSSKN